MQDFLKQHLLKAVIGIVASTITGSGIYFATSLPNKPVSPVEESTPSGEVMSAQIEEPEETPTPSPTAIPTSIPIKTSTPTPTPTPSLTPNATQNTESNNNAAPTNTPSPTPEPTQSTEIALEACFTHDAYYFYDETHLDASCSKGNIVEYKWVIGKTQHTIQYPAKGKIVTVRFEIYPDMTHLFGESWKPDIADVLLTITDDKGETKQTGQSIKLEVPENRLSEKWW